MAMPDYEFYKMTYKGDALEEKDFRKLAIRAISYLERLERSVEVNYFDTEKGRCMAACAVMEELKITEDAKKHGHEALTGAAKSVSVGSVSISSGAASVQEYQNIIASVDSRCYSAVSFYAELYHGGSWCV